jgi:hypothetical protein
VEVSSELRSKTSVSLESSGANDAPPGRLSVGNSITHQNSKAPLLLAAEFSRHGPLRGDGSATLPRAVRPQRSSTNHGKLLFCAQLRARAASRQFLRSTGAICHHRMIPTRHAVLWGYHTHVTPSDQAPVPTAHAPVTRITADPSTASARPRARTSPASPRRSACAPRPARVPRSADRRWPRARS